MHQWQHTSRTQGSCKRGCYKTVCSFLHQQCLATIDFALQPFAADVFMTWVMHDMEIAPKHGHRTLLLGYWTWPSWQKKIMIHDHVNVIPQSLHYIQIYPNISIHMSNQKDISGTMVSWDDWRHQGKNLSKDSPSMTIAGFFSHLRRWCQRSRFTKTVCSRSLKRFYQIHQKV